MSGRAGRVLVLGGTGEARELAALLDDAGARVTSSLAGRVSKPRLPRGDVRIGGFGGPDALAVWLRKHEIAAVVDATHPFAERISTSAGRAAPAARIPLLRLERPGWSAGPGDDWRWVDDQPAAAGLVRELGAERVLLTTGRQGLAAFAPVDSAWFLVRCVEPPDPPLPARCEVLLDRGPYSMASERALMASHEIDLLVTKDSGGSLTEAKLEAARERGIPVVVVRRPARPAAVAAVATAAEAATWALAQLSASAGG